VRIKFCGITREADARLAAALGVDAIGLVLTQKSPRFPGLAQARRIRATLPPFVATVALFLDDAVEWVREAIAVVEPDLLQFHGREDAAQCLGYGRPYLKTLAMQGGGDVLAVIAAHPEARGFLLDGHQPGEPGGRGLTFDWTRAPRHVQPPLILAGGLTCDNVAAAIRTVRPYGVDVSSGIESAPGIKDPDKMRRFVAEVARVGSQIQEPD
jgi:phosphoribosylanthranilate isomerase